MARKKKEEELDLEPEEDVTPAGDEEKVEITVPEPVVNTSILEELNALVPRIDEFVEAIAVNVNPTNIFAEKYRKISMNIVDLKRLAEERGHEGLPVKNE